MRVYPSILFHLSSSGSWAGAYHSTSWTGHQSWVCLCVCRHVCVLPIRPRSTSASFSISGMLWSIVDKAVEGQSTNMNSSTKRGLFISEFTLQHFCCHRMSIFQIICQWCEYEEKVWTPQSFYEQLTSKNAACYTLSAMPSVSSLLSVYHTVVQPHCSLLCLHDKLCDSARLFASVGTVCELSDRSSTIM